MSKLDLLTPHQFTEVGQYLLEYLDMGTLKGVEVPYIVVKGFAGTGKSFVLNTVLDTMQYKPTQVAMSAPTHKAVKILKRNSEIEYVFRTIHSLLKLKENISDNGVRTFVEDQWAPKDLDSCTVLIIDESSMLPKILYERVLNYKAQRESSFRLVFCGDPLQIPPVKEHSSLVFMPISEPYTVTLTDPMRQTSDSGILKFATDLRNNIESTSIQLKNYLTFPDIEYLKESVFETSILPKFKDGYEENQDSVKFLSYTNVQADEANKMVREYRLGLKDPPRIVEGDYLVATEHIVAKIMGKQTIIAHNSDEMKVLELAVVMKQFTYLAYRTTEELAKEVFGDSLPTGKELFEGINMAVNTARVMPYLTYRENLKVYECTVEMDNDMGEKVERRITVVHEDSQARFDTILKGLSTLAIYAHLKKKAWVEKFTFQRSVALVTHSYALTVHKS